MTAGLDTIIANLEFGPATAEPFQKNDNCPALGGWVNVSIPIRTADGRKIGQALVRAWVVTNPWGEYDDSDTANTVRRDGFAITVYYGPDERRLDIIDGIGEAIGLTEDNDISDEDIEEALLNAAYEADDTDYEGIFRTALERRLHNTADDSTRDLIEAVLRLDREE